MKVHAVKYTSSKHIYSPHQFAMFHINTFQFINLHKCQRSIINLHLTFKGAYNQITFMKIFMQSSQSHNSSQNIFKVNDLNTNAMFSSCVQWCIKSNNTYHNTFADLKSSLDGSLKHIPYCIWHLHKCEKLSTISLHLAYVKKAIVLYLACLHKLRKAHYGA